MCFDCPDWDQCSGCTIEEGDLTPVCEVPLLHTTATEPGSTLETLNIEGGYWRATITSKKILACYNPNACSGGRTGTDSFCASGYDGPCEGVTRRSKLDTCKNPCPRFLRMLRSLIFLLSPGRAYLHRLRRV